MTLFIKFFLLISIIPVLCNDTFSDFHLSNAADAFTKETAFSRLNRALLTPKQQPSYSKFPHFIGSNLFGGDRKKCFSLEDVKLLAARQEFERTMVPQNVPPTLLLDDESITIIMRYFSHGHLFIRRMEDNSESRILRKAFFDTFGGYLHYYLLPVVKMSYYVGNVQLRPVLKVLDYYQKCRFFLNTNGNGWRAPHHYLVGDIKTLAYNSISTDDHSPYKINPSDDYCMGLKLLDSKDIEIVDGNMIVPLPRIDLEEKDGYLGNIWLPYERKSTYSLRSRSSAFLIVKFYKKVSLCYRQKNVRRDSFDKKFEKWISENLLGHLFDEEFYPSFGGLLSLYNNLRHKEDKIPYSDNGEEKETYKHEYDNVGSVKEKRKSSNYIELEHKSKSACDRDWLPMVHLDYNKEKHKIHYSKLAEILNWFDNEEMSFENGNWWTKIKNITKILLLLLLMLIILCVLCKMISLLIAIVLGVEGPIGGDCFGVMWNLIAQFFIKSYQVIVFGAARSSNSKSNKPKDTPQNNKTQITIPHPRPILKTTVDLTAKVPSNEAKRAIKVTKSGSQKVDSVLSQKKINSWFSKRSPAKPESTEKEAERKTKYKNPTIQISVESILSEMRNTDSLRRKQKKPNSKSVSPVGAQAKAAISKHSKKSASQKNIASVISNSETMKKKEVNSDKIGKWYQLKSSDRSTSPEKETKTRVKSNPPGKVSVLNNQSSTQESDTSTSPEKNVGKYSSLKRSDKMFASNKSIRSISSEELIGQQETTSLKRPFKGSDRSSSPNKEMSKSNALHEQLSKKESIIPKPRDKEIEEKVKTSTKNTNLFIFKKVNKSPSPEKDLQRGLASSKEQFKSTARTRNFDVTHISKKNSSQERIRSTSPETEGKKVGSDKSPKWYKFKRGDKTATPKKDIEQITHIPRANDKSSSLENVVESYTVLSKLPTGDEFIESANFEKNKANPELYERSPSQSSIGSTASDETVHKKNEASTKNTKWFQFKKTEKNNSPKKKVNKGTAKAEQSPTNGSFKSFFSEKNAERNSASFRHKTPSQSSIRPIFEKKKEKERTRSPQPKATKTSGKNLEERAESRAHNSKKYPSQTRIEKTIILDRRSPFKLTSEPNRKKKIWISESKKGSFIQAMTTNKTTKTSPQLSSSGSENLKPSTKVKKKLSNAKEKEFTSKTNKRMLGGEEETNELFSDSSISKESWKTFYDF